METNIKNNILVGECLIDVQYDFQMDEFMERFNYILCVDKCKLRYKLEFKDIWTKYSDEVLEAEGTSREEVIALYKSIDRCLMNINSLCIHECRYVFNNSGLKIFMKYVCDSGFKDVEDELSRYVDIAYRVYLHEKKQNNSKFKKERI